jgi:hypothetical protein
MTTPFDRSHGDPFIARPLPLVPGSTPHHHAARQRGAVVSRTDATSIDLYISPPLTATVTAT